jgi:lipopolysaccharide biosynthesis regulator YciM
MIETIIVTIFSTLPVGTAIGWFFTKRKRDNDFITDLQSSIDLLSENYTKTLDNLIILKKQNADLLILVSQLETEISKLKEENSTLLKKMNELKKMVAAK